MKTYPYQTPEGIIELVEKRGLEQLIDRLAESEELIREIRDDEINPQDEADKFLRDHQPSELAKMRAANAELIERLAEARESHLAASARDVQTIQRQAIMLERLAGALRAVNSLGSDEFIGSDKVWSDASVAAFHEGITALAAYESANLEPGSPCTPPGEYGEPWTCEAFNATLGETGDYEGVALLRTRNGHLIAEKHDVDDIDEDHLSRAAQCVNACAGMVDPAAEIERFKANNRYQSGYHVETEAMREKLLKVEEAFQKIIRSVPACVNGFWFWPSISPDGDYLGEIPTDPDLAIQEMQAIAETALTQLQNT